MTPFGVCVCVCVCVCVPAHPRACVQREKVRPNLKINVSSTAAETPAPAPTQIDWRKGDLLGMGSFGKVYRGLNTLTGACLPASQLAS